VHVGLFECGKSLFSVVAHVIYDMSRPRRLPVIKEREGNVLINGAAHGGLSHRWALVFDPGHGAMGQGQTACPTGGWMGRWRGDRLNRRLIEVWLYSALTVKWNAQVWMQHYCDEYVGCSFKWNSSRYEMKFNQYIFYCEHFINAGMVSYIFHICLVNFHQNVRSCSKPIV